jgi:hypothetical protein
MGKFDNNFIWKYRELTPEIEKMRAASPIVSTPMLWLDDKVARGSFYIECHWQWSLPPDAPPQKMEVSHAHEFDEVLGFLGSRQEDPTDLGAEIDIYLEDEMHSFNKTCFIFVPKGMKHTPITFKKIYHPFMFITAGNGNAYGRVGQKGPS